MLQLSMCNNCRDLPEDDTCNNCTVKSTETELCEECFRKKLKKQRLRKEMQEQFRI